ncbi:MAG: contractile injection system protein, VgrG/Pvc8 family, partial [Jatrophihabitans sp.]
MTATVFPLATIRLGATHGPLDAKVADAIHRVVVDQNANLPATVEIWLSDPNGELLSSSGFDIGQLVTVAAPSGSSGQTAALITAEITSVGGHYRGLAGQVVLRGYSREHRLQRARRSRAYLNMKDSDIAREIANNAKLPVGDIDETRTAHSHLAQINETDWAFLHRRAAEIGFELRMIEDRFCFQKAPAGRSAAAIPLARADGLWSFAPRITAAGLTGQVEVRVWNPAARKVVAETVPVTSDFTDLSGQRPSTLAGTFATVTVPPTPAAPDSAV